MSKIEKRIIIGIITGIAVCIIISFISANYININEIKNLFK